MIVRILSFFLLGFSILFLPFYISIILGLLAMIYNKIFWEAIPLFLLSDLLYGVKEIKFNNMLFISFFVSIVVLILVELFKKKLKFYP